ncbi:MAG: hypothetical protein BWZ04_03257 [Firmicutes bacterium ADurb.BinA205]|nr:MAG: hypothetical protein BWZ04_03257 [Firmicutes bacterium ADurb.BinA205]
MKIYALGMLITGGILLAGCSSDEEKKPVPQEFINVPLYTANGMIPEDSKEKYAYNPDVKAYAVGRIVDAKSNTMREGGTVYRLEKPPQWNLIPQYDQNPAAIARTQMQEQYGDAMTGQIVHAMRSVDDMKGDTQQTLDNQVAINKKLEALKVELAKSSAEKKVMAENIKMLRDYIENLEKQLKDMQLSGGVRK